MCDFEKRLVAYLDQELPDNEAAEIGRHLEDCAECRALAAQYARTSAQFAAYCDALSAAQTPRKTRSSKAAALAMGAVAAAVAVALLAHHSRGQLRPAQAQLRMPAPSAAAPRARMEAAPVSRPQATAAAVRPGVAKAPHQSLAARVPKAQADFILPGPAVQIMIPADAVLPPGAAPAGTNYVVDFSIAPDGSAQGIRVSPELTGFERRAARP